MRAWGFLVFARYAPPVADRLLHPMMTQNPKCVEGVALLLLIDALYGLHRLI